MKRNVRRSLTASLFCLGFAAFAASPALAQAQGERVYGGAGTQLPNVGNALPGPGGVVPGPGGVVPGPGGVVPGPGGVVPGPGGVVPGPGGVVPGPGGVVPTGGSVLPATGEVLSTTGNSSPSGNVLSSTGQGVGQPAALPLQVSSGVRATSQARVQGLAFTGADIAGLMVIGLVAMAIGVVLTRRARPRTSS